MFASVHLVPKGQTARPNARPHHYFLSISRLVRFISCSNIHRLCVHTDDERTPTRSLSVRFEPAWQLRTYHPPHTFTAHMRAILLGSHPGRAVVVLFNVKVVDRWSPHFHFPGDACLLVARQPNPSPPLLYLPTSDNGGPLVSRPQDEARPQGQVLVWRRRRFPTPPPAWQGPPSHLWQPPSYVDLTGDDDDE